MAFPVVQSYSSGTTSNTTSHTLTMPSGITNGDLIVVSLGFSDPAKTNLTISVNTGSSSSGWTLARGGSLTSTYWMTGRLYFKYANTTESLTFTTTNAGNMTYQVYRISGANQISHANQASVGANPDPTVINPAYTADHLYMLSMVTWNNTLASAVSTGFGTDVTTNGVDSTSAHIKTVRKTENSSSTDPSAWTQADTGWILYRFAAYYREIVTISPVTTIAVTPQAATIVEGPTEEIIAVDTQSYSVTTQTATLNEAYVVVADAAGVSITAEDVVINAVENVAIDAAAITVDAQDASILTAEIVAIDAASVSVTTQDSEINAREVIPADVAQVSTSPLDATINARELLTTDLVTIDVTTLDPNTKADEAVAIDTASVAVTTQDPDVVLNETYVIDLASVSVTANDVTLVEPTTIQVSTASYAVTTLDPFVQAIIIPQLTKIGGYDVGVNGAGSPMSISITAGKSNKLLVFASYFTTTPEIEVSTGVWQSLSAVGSTGFYYANEAQIGSKTTINLRWTSTLGTSSRAVAVFADVDQTNPIASSQVSSVAAGTSTTWSPSLDPNHVVLARIAPQPYNWTFAPNFSGDLAQKWWISYVGTAGSRSYGAFYSEITNGTNPQLVPSDATHSSTIGPIPQGTASVSWLALKGAINEGLVSCDTASITVTTQAPTVSIFEAIPVETASVAITTLDANIQDNVRIETDTASIAVTTQDPALNEGFFISVDTASVAVTTQDPEVNASENIPVDAASIAVTTYDPEIDQTVDADTATISVTTYDVTTNAVENIPVDVASIAVTIEDASINEAENIPVDVASIAVTTEDPRVGVDVTVAIDTATIEVTMLDTGGEIVFVDTTSIAVTTLDATLVDDENVAIDTASVVVTTLDASINEEEAISIDTDAITITTFDITLNEQERIFTDTAEVAVVTYPAVINAQEWIAINTAAIDVTTYEAWLPIYFGTVITEAKIIKWVQNEGGAAVKTVETTTGAISFKADGTWIKPEPPSAEWTIN